MKIALSAESTIDLTPELLKKYKISIVPFHIILGEESFDDNKIQPSEIFKFAHKSKKLPKTSAVNKDEFKAHFTELQKDNDAIIHFSLSSHLSAAYDQAIITASEMKNVYIINTLNLSTGIALLAIYASKLIEQNLPIEEIVEKVKARIPYVQASFVIDKLTYLHKGGRCNSVQLLGANLLKLKPQIIVKDGEMQSAKKYRGNFDKILPIYYEDVLKEFDNPDYSVVFITYTTCTKDNLKYAEDFLKSKGFKDIYITTAGGTISSHCGENSLGILYINDGNH